MTGEAIKIGGRTVGFIRGKVQYKECDEDRHFLHTPEAICWANQALVLAQQRGCDTTEIYGRRSGRTWRAPLSAFWKKGFPVERGGWEPQRGLALRDFSRDDEPPVEQLELF